ncbi:alpha/beta hydrolase [uncultured Parasphingorhabdus sp.]|uniref:alpha/beta fold hydrolase n=1 Tax=uncultured Parasphingorhabdus sp. TaxID=2709694 RepID=UPI002AA78D45|nr:alpha/beta hydrolase [uncultured Parasphingorhabdus sp.]
MSNDQEIPDLPGRYILTDDGVPIAAYETGNPDGPCILFIHGFGFCHAAFLRQFSGPLARDYRLISLDLRGHGNSGKPSDRQAYTTTNAWAHDIEAVRRAFDLRDAVVVGWSFGSMVFMDWVRNYGIGDFRGFVSVGSNGAMIDASEEYRLQRAQAVLRVQDKQPNFAAELREAKNAADRNVYRSVDSGLREMMVLSNLKLSLYATKVMAEMEHDSHDLIPALTCPVLFILGEHDAANSEETLQELASSLPDATVQMMDGVGHSPFLEDPPSFNFLIDNFMRELG